MHRAALLRVTDVEKPSEDGVEVNLRHFREPSITFRELLGNSQTGCERCFRDLDAITPGFWNIFRELDVVFTTFNEVLSVFLHRYRRFQRHSEISSSFNVFLISFCCLFGQLNNCFQNYTLFCSRKPFPKTCNFHTLEQQRKD
jgi:hypothetical protein